MRPGSLHRPFSCAWFTTVYTNGSYKSDMSSAIPVDFSPGTSVSQSSLMPYSPKRQDTTHFGSLLVALADQDIGLDVRQAVTTW